MIVVGSFYGKVFYNCAPNETLLKNKGLTVSVHLRVVVLTQSVSLHKSKFSVIHTSNVVSFAHVANFEISILQFSFEIFALFTSPMMETDGKSQGLPSPPEAPAGLHFANVIPVDFVAGYEAYPPAESEKSELRTKMRSTRLKSRRHSKVFEAIIFS